MDAKDEKAASPTVYVEVLFQRSLKNEGAAAVSVLMNPVWSHHENTS